MHKLLNTCGSDEYGFRDKAILLTLVDTGLRASELTSLNLDNINLVTGEIVVFHGKGDKARFVYLGKKSRQTLRRYIKVRKSEISPLFLSRYSERLDYVYN